MVVYFKQCSSPQIHVFYHLNQRGHLLTLLTQPKLSKNNSSIICLRFLDKASKGESVIPNVSLIWQAYSLHAICHMKSVFKISILDDFCMEANTSRPGYTSRVSCQKGPICHAEAWQVGPFWQDTLDMWNSWYLSSTGWESSEKTWCG